MTGRDSLDQLTKGWGETVSWLRQLDVERREWLIHQGPREAHTLPHAPPKAHADRPTEAVEADEVDGCEGSPPDLRVAETERLQAYLDVLEDGQPRKQREALEHHRDPGAGAATG